MQDRVLVVLSDVMNVPLNQLNDDSSAENVGTWDSIKHLDLVLAIEEEFGVTISHDDIEGMQSVRDIRDTLKKVGAPGG